MRTGQRAVVLGASVAGSLAARVLCDSFEEVVIVEPDRLPENAEFRKGVPQSRHIHVLLVRGAQIVERPGLSTRLAQRYFDRLLEVATVDEHVSTAFLRVLHLLDPPGVLFRPGVLTRALLGARRPLLTEPPTATAVITPTGEPV